VDRILPFLSQLSRRRFLGTASAATLIMASPKSAEAAAEPSPRQSESVALTVNGRRHALDLEPRVTLLDALREHLGLTGTKKGCDQASAAPAQCLSMDNASTAA
jgi:xanthine dehydrogenase YagT iron-sulfur-binding subunit